MAHSIYTNFAEKFPCLAGPSNDIPIGEQENLIQILWNIPIPCEMTEKAPVQDFVHPIQKFRIDVFRHTPQDGYSTLPAIVFFKGYKVTASIRATVTRFYFPEIFLEAESMYCSGTKGKHRIEYMIGNGAIYLVLEELQVTDSMTNFVNHLLSMFLSKDPTSFRVEIAVINENALAKDAPAGAKVFVGSFRWDFNWILTNIGCELNSSVGPCADENGRLTNTAGYVSRGTQAIAPQGCVLRNVQMHLKSEKVPFIMK